MEGAYKLQFFFNTRKDSFAQILIDSLLGKYINYLLMYPVNLLKKNRSEEITKQQLYSICFMNTFPQDFPHKTYL